MDQLVGMLASEPNDLDWIPRIYIVSERGDVMIFICMWWDMCTHAHAHMHIHTHEMK